MTHSQRAAILLVAGFWVVTEVGQAAARRAEERAAPSRSVVRSETPRGAPAGVE